MHLCYYIGQVFFLFFTETFRNRILDVQLKAQLSMSMGFDPLNAPKKELETREIRFKPCFGDHIRIGKGTFPSQIM